MATTKRGVNAELQLEQAFGVSRETLYAAWTQAEALKRWHAPGEHVVSEAEADVRVGGRYRITMQAPDKKAAHTVTGEYREIVPNERLVYTWCWENDEQEVGETLVTVTFESKGDGSIVRVTHERFPTEDDRDKHRSGWCGCLENLGKVILEN